MARGDQIVIPVVELEFREGGNTLWIHSPGGTVLRIQCSGQIRVDGSCENPIPHADVQVHGDIAICIPQIEEKRSHE